MYDTDATLLYVGITSRVTGVRFAEHEDLADWYGDVMTITLQHFESRKDLEDAERRAIIDEGPKYNIVGTKEGFHHRFNRNRLRLIRRSRGLTQRELAEKTGFRETLIQQYEQGRVQPPVEKLAILSDVLGVPMNAFIGAGNFPGRRDLVRDARLQEEAKGVKL
jgi:DNA-binding XRE family transcriptional regulator